MCKPVKNYLELLREFTPQIITFGGFIIAAFLYFDFKELVIEQASTNAKTAEVLRTINEQLKKMDIRLERLETEHIKAGISTPQQNENRR